MAEIIVTSNFLKKTGGVMSGDLLTASGVSIVPEFSGASSLGDPQHPFSTIYTDTIVGRNITTKNVVYVKQNPSVGEFSSIAVAVSSITDADPNTNPYIVYVGPGLYSEPEIVVTAGINIVGMDESSVIVQPIGNNNVLNLQSMATASFLTIQNTTNGYYGTVVNDPGDFVLMHKVTYENCYESFISTCSGTIGNQLYLEYVDATQDDTTGTAFQFLAPSGSTMAVSLENWYVFGNTTNPPVGVLTQGQGLTVRSRASALIGDVGDNGIALLNLQGASVVLSELGISNWSVGIQIPPDAYSPNVELYSVSFNNCSEYLIINNQYATGFSYIPIPRNKLIVNELSSFYVIGFDPFVINVADKGGDYNSVLSALQSINTTGPTNQYIINVGPGVFVENNPIPLKPFVSIVGINSNTSIIEAQNPNLPLFEVCAFANLQDLTLAGTTGNYLLDFANNNAFAASGYMTIKDCYVGLTYGIAYVHPQTDNSTFLACLNIQALPQYSITQAFKIEAYPQATLSESAIVIQGSLFSFQAMPATTGFIYASGTHATVVMDGVSVQTLVPASGSVGLEFIDGPQIRLSDTSFDGYQTAILNPNYGVGSFIIGNGITCLNSNNYDIQILNPSTTGTFMGMASLEKTVLSSGIGGLISDPVDNDAYSIGDFEGTKSISAPLISGVTVLDSTGRVVTSVNGINGPSVSISTSDVPEGTNLYFTDARAQAAVSGGSVNITGVPPINVLSGSISILQAGGRVDGYLSSSDWNMFNGKQDALGYTPLNVAGDTMNGDLHFASSVSIINNFSGTNNLATLDSPFNDIYTNNIFIDGSRFNPQNLNVANVIRVAQFSTSGFNSISQAINSISDSSITKPYIIFVEPGTYIEPAMTLPAYVSIVGREMDAVVIIPSGNYDLFTMGNNSHINFVTIFGNANSTSSSAITLTDTGSYNVFHKVYVNDFNKGWTISNTTPGTASYIYLEYCSYQGQNVGLPTYGISVSSNLGSSTILSVDAENLTIYGYNQNPTNGIILDGIDVQFLGKVVGFGGQDSTGNAVTIQNGASADFSAGDISTFNTGFNVPQVGTSPNLTLSAINFGNNSGLDLNVVHSSATGYSASIPPYTKTYINQANSFYLVGTDQHELTVSAKGGDFTNVKDAIDSISDNSPYNRYVIKVGPSIFVENNPIQLKAFVSIVGDSNIVSTIQAGNSSLPLFSGAAYATVENVQIQGTMASGTYLFDWNETNIGGFINTQNLVIGPTYGIARVQAASGISANFGAFGYKSLDISSIQVGFEAIGFQNPDPSNRVAVHVQNGLFFDSQAPFTALFAEVHGNNALLQLDDVLVQNTIAVSGNIGIIFYDNSTVRTFNAIMDGFDKAYWNKNLGGPCGVLFNPITIINADSDIVLEHPQTSGTIMGTFQKQNSTIVSPLVSTLGNDPVNFSTFSVGEFFVGPTQSQLTEMTQLWIQTPTMGLITVDNPPLTQLPAASGLTLLVNSGTGYIDNGQLVQLNWPTQTLTIGANADVYIYINSAGNVATSVSDINGSVDSILLGRAFAGPTSILSVGNTYMDAHHNGNAVDEYLRDVFGAIVATGLQITASGLQLNMTGGEYYYASHNYNVNSQAPIAPFYQFYHLSGSQFASINTSGVVSTTLFDNGYNLSGLSIGYYTKHSMWYVGGTNQSLLVFGQNQYSGLSQVQNAVSPTAPEPFKDAVVHLADIIVNQASGSIVQIIDTRPTPSYKAPTQVGSSTGVTIHSQLLGLAADDHTQYLLDNGTRAMGGNLNMSGNSITNVNLINNIDILNHESRHLPNGADPITTDTPIDVSLAGGNYVGIANSLARSDHRHNLQGANSSQGGFLSSADWNTFNNKQPSGTYLVSGTSTTYIPEGTNLYYTDARVASNANLIFVSGVANLASGNASLALAEIALISGASTTAIQSGTGLGNVTVTKIGTILQISGTQYSLPSTVVQSASHSGTGFSVYNSQNNSNLVFNSISGTGLVTVSYNNGLITVSGAGTVGNFIVSGSSTILNVLDATVVSGTTISGGSIYSNGVLLQNYVLPTSLTGLTLVDSTVVSGTTISGNAFYLNGVPLTNYILPTIINANILSGTTISGNQIYENGVLVATQTDISNVSGIASTASANATLALNEIALISGNATTAVQNASNLGTGIGLFSGKSGTNLQFNSISGVGNVVATLVGNVIQISDSNVNNQYVVSGSSTILNVLDVTTLSGTTVNSDTINAKNVTASVELYSPIVSGTTINNDTFNGKTGTFTVTVNSQTVSGTTVNTDTVNAKNVTASVEIYSPTVSGTTISGNTFSVGSAITAQISGTENIGSASVPFGELFVTPKEYVFAYDTTTQNISVGNTFQTVNFATASQINGWTHASSGVGFTANVGALYKVDYTVTAQKTGGSNSPFEVRATVGGVEVAGSQASYINSTNNVPTTLTRSFITNVASGQVLNLQVAASGTSSQLVGVGVQATNKPSATINIVRFI